MNSKGFKVVDSHADLRDVGDNVVLARSKLHQTEVERNIYGSLTSAFAVLT